MTLKSNCDLAKLILLTDPLLLPHFINITIMLTWLLILHQEKEIEKLIEKDKAKTFNWNQTFGLSQVSETKDEMSNLKLDPVADIISF